MMLKQTDLPLERKGLQTQMRSTQVKSTLKILQRNLKLPPQDQRRNNPQQAGLTQRSFSSPISLQTSTVGHKRSYPKNHFLNKIPLRLRFRQLQVISMKVYPLSPLGHLNPISP